MRPGLVWEGLVALIHASQMIRRLSGVGSQA